jgi:D-alanyl-lipoteichoic acid acyltransferase DltB (MBOAT superfamily)
LLQAISYVAVFLACIAVRAKVRRVGVRQIALLAASYGLYLTWVPWFAAVLVTSVVVNFLLGKWLRKSSSALSLWTGIIFNLALLGTFKYLPEIASHVPLGSLQGFSKLALPLGISFWTFQAMSYLFDLYRGEELDPSLAEFALYMAFFPVTIAGPVCRLPEMLPQFRSQEGPGWSDVAEGFRRIAVGVFMLLLARLLGQGILAGDSIVSGFDRSARWSGPDVWLLAFGYGLQLFFDFAGYTHVAVGAARAMGIEVPENFQRPFASTSPSIFWTRWHMSLSFWIRDYVFFPLAPLRREIWWRNLALVISMVVFGLWHKASLLFLIWGLYHGVLLVLHRQIQQMERRLNWTPPERFWDALSWIATMALISLGWIFFRANSLPQAGQMLKAITSPSTYASHSLSSSLYLLVGVLAAGYALVLLVARVLERQTSAISRWRWYWLPPLYALAMGALLMITLTQSGGVGQLMYRGF